MLTIHHAPAILSHRRSHRRPHQVGASCARPVLRVKDFDLRERVFVVSRDRRRATARGILVARRPAVAAAAWTPEALSLLGVGRKPRDGGCARPAAAVAAGSDEETEGEDSKCGDEERGEGIAPAGDDEGGVVVPRHNGWRGGRG